VARAVVSCNGRGKRRGRIITSEDPECYRMIGKDEDASRRHLSSAGAEGRLNLKLHKFLHRASRYISFLLELKRSHSYVLYVMKLNLTKLRV
jgi:hypothetical protein